MGRWCVRGLLEVTDGVGWGGHTAQAHSGPSPASLSAPARVRRPAPAPAKVRVLGERRCSASGSGAERSAWRPPPTLPTLPGRPCPPCPGPAALPSAALRLRARRGRGRGRGPGRAGETRPGRRAAAGMRSWRRNLALCLQRLPDEGRTRRLSRPGSCRAARAGRADQR